MIFCILQKPRPRPMVLSGLAALAVAAAFSTHLRAQTADVASLQVVVPLDVSDVTEDTIGIEVGCLVYSSLAPDLGPIGAGRVVIIRNWISVDTYDAFQARFANAAIPTSFEQLDLAQLGGTIAVVAHEMERAMLAGWTHGECHLGVYAPRISTVGEFGSTPLDCYATETVEPVALCAFPGTDLITETRFSRPGFALDGTVQTLPGIDE
jgi:hypothetical protein